MLPYISTFSKLQKLPNLKTFFLKVLSNQAIYQNLLIMYDWEKHDKSHVFMSKIEDKMSNFLDEKDWQAKISM